MAQVDRPDPPPDRTTRSAYYARVKARWRASLATHVRTQVIVSLLIGAFSGAIALAAGQGVGALLYGAGGAGLWIVLAGFWYRRGAPVELDRELRRARDDAQVERDALVAERTRPPVRVERESALVDDDNIVLLRLRVFNDAQSGEANLEVEVTELEDRPAWWPETPWHVFWRHSHSEYTRRLRGPSSEIVDFVNAPIINMASAREKAVGDRWVPAFFFLVVGAEGNEAVPNGAILQGVETVDDAIGREMVARLRVSHDENVLLEKRIVLFFKEEDGGLVPDLRVCDV